MKHSLFALLLIGFAMLAMAMTPEVLPSDPPAQTEIGANDGELTFPSDVVFICKDTIIQTPNGGCIRVGCQQQGCDDCCLAWKDKNGNGLINKGELRCRCKTTKTADGCTLRREQVACPD